MPKETIYSDVHRSDREASGDVQNVIDVMWRKGGDPHFSVEIMAHTKSPERARAREAAESPTSPDAIALTRENINVLIRTLRKARDQAFGQDA